MTFYGNKRFMYRHHKAHIAIFKLFNQPWMSIRVSWSGT